tara:strand:- start:4643 stop:5635 length:993 start_codon:yes stop_codon:yes gene_type:complete
MEPLLLIIIFASFLCTYLILPSWIKKANLNGLTGKDMHKKNKRKIAEGGGVAVLAGASLGILLYIALNTFYFNSDGKLIYIFALLSVLLITSIVGIVDDLLGWKKGLSKKIRIIIILFAAIPLMVINAGNSIMSLPFFGMINFELLYPLIIIPLGILGATVTYNTLAGYNGLETSQGIIILLALSIVTYITGNSWLSVIALFMTASLIAFYIFNKYPAKVFPGDILTYSTGALIASIAILGNIEKIAVFFFIPYIIEAVLKTRGKWVKESFAKLNKEGSLEMPYKKIYGLEHLAIYILKKFKENVYEKEVVYLINGFQISIIILGFLIFM